MTQAWTLDADILQLVLGYFEHDKRFLVNMSLLGKGVHPLVLPVLYRFNSFASITPAFKFCRALQDHSQSPACFVRKLHVHTSHSLHKKEFYWSKEAREYVKLIHETLPLLLNLQELRISGVEFKAKQLLWPPPFSLQSLNLLLPVAAPLGEFFRAQKSLTHLELRSSRVPFGEDDCLELADVTSNNLLPALTTLKACSEAFVVLAPGRPIANATVNWCKVHQSRTLMSSLVFAIGQSTASVTALKVDLHSLQNTRCVDFVLSLESTKLTSSLETLTLVTTHLDNEYWMPPHGSHSDFLTPPPKLFSRFSALRNLIIAIPAAVVESQIFCASLGELSTPEEQFDSIWSYIGGKESWQASCRALTNIRIYGQRLNLGPRDLGCSV